VPCTGQAHTCDVLRARNASATGMRGSVAIAHVVSSARLSNTPAARYSNRPHLRPHGQTYTVTRLTSCLRRCSMYPLRQENCTRTSKSPACRPQQHPSRGDQPLPCPFTAVRRPASRATLCSKKYLAPPRQLDMKNPSLLCGGKAI
jgi:hypothetical protein